MIRYLLDEHIPLTVAAECRALGLDVVTVHSLDLLGSDDRVQAERAATEGRCLVTRNYADFIQITTERWERRLPHSGMILIPRSIHENDIGTMVNRLNEIASNHPDGLPAYTIIWM